MIGSVVLDEVHARGRYGMPMDADVVCKLLVGGVAILGQGCQVGALFPGECVGVPEGVVDPIASWVCQEFGESFRACGSEVEAVVDEPKAGVVEVPGGTLVSGLYGDIDHGACGDVVCSGCG